LKRVLCAQERARPRAGRGGIGGGGAPIPFRQFWT
jgi:hypothetical protein